MRTKVSRCTDAGEVGGRFRALSLVASFLALTMVLAACSGDDTSAPEPGEPAPPAEEPEEGEDEAAAPGEPVYGGTLRMAHVSDPISIDHMTTEAQPVSVKEAVFERLYGFGVDLVPRPFLAESHAVSDDRLTWTITLRQGILFHNGEEMTADDLVASFERFVEVGRRRFELEMVDSVEAVDDYTLQINLIQPHGGLLESLSAASGAWVAMPRSVIEQLGPPFEEQVELSAETMVGTGPYKYVEHEPEQLWVFERFDDYWGGPPEYGPEDGYMVTRRAAYLDRVELHIITDPSTRVAAVLAGEVDIALPIPADSAEAVKDEPGINIQTTIPGRRVYWKFNTYYPPFDDINLRRAVRAGIDPEALMAPFGPPEYWRVNCTVRQSQEHWGWKDMCGPEYYPRDIELAKEMVAEHYDGTPVVVLASEGRAEYPTTVPMITYLEEIGFDVEPNIVDIAGYSEGRNDPHSGWNMKHAGGQSMTSIRYMDAPAKDRQGEVWPGLDPDYLPLIDAANLEEDPDERRRLLQEAWDVLHESHVDMWFGDEFTVALYRDGLNGVPVDDDDYSWLNMWIDPM